MLVVPKLQNLPSSFPIEGAVRIELVEGIPIFRASSTVRDRIETLLEKQYSFSLDPEEERELDLYEEIDDYLSIVNRTVRNFYLADGNPEVVELALRDLDDVKAIAVSGNSETDDRELLQNR